MSEGIEGARDLVPDPSRAETLADQTDRPSDPNLSQAETYAGDSSAFEGPPRPRPGKEPDFPVKDWDRYEFLGFLGQGGMGMVFLARDRKLGREVAIKFVRLEDERHLQRFMVEARAQARVDHEHVCKVFEVGEVEGRVFITMQRITGDSLDVATSGLSLEQKVIALRDAARGVHEAHRVGIIHRDLKPSNIMVERGEDGALRTFVMDFGLAREWNQDVTETGSVLGTPAYMSPEQARGELDLLDRRTDIYSLGATLYQVTTGRPPVPGANALEILSAIGSVDIQPMRVHSLDIPRDLEAITLKCLEKDRARRYDSAKALADDLDRFLAGESVVARHAGLIYRTHRRFMRHKALAITGTVAVVLVLLALGLALKTRRDAARRERLAQQFMESMARIESLARYSALSPLHDIRPDLQTVRAHMTQLQEDMRRAGALANGPGHYALGRGYLTLDDQEKAREHLQMAWDAGYREPRVAFALALVLGHQYQEKLLEAERMPSADQREARTRQIDATLRTPTLGFLRQARGADVPSPAYLEALMAFYEGRLDEALARLKALGSELPWFFEAPLLRGSLLQARAWTWWNQGKPEAALADFETGRRDLAAAAASGRSAPAAYAALAELELNALIMEKYGQGQVRPAFERGMAAVRQALAAQPDHVASLILQAALLGQYADSLTTRGENADALVQEAVAVAWQAQRAGPARVDAWVALGKAYYQWGNARQEKNLDPTEQLEKGLKALESLSLEKRDYTVENHLGLIHQTWSDYEDQQGRDPSGHLSGAIAAYERATQMEPHLLPAWINLGTCLQQRAGLPRAADPEADLQTALQVLAQAHTLNPRHFVPYYVQGKVLFSLALRKQERGENPEPDLLQSVDANRRGLAINAGIPHLHNGVGVAQLLLARQAWDTGRDPKPFLAGADRAFRKAIEVAPKQVLGYINLGDLLIWKARHGQGAIDLQAALEAETMLRRGLAVSPGDQGSLVNLGRLAAVRVEGSLRHGGEFASFQAGGEAVLAKVLTRDPRHRDALEYLGELRTAAAMAKARRGQAQAKDFEVADQILARALEILPDSQESWLQRARLCLARAEWERSTARDPAPSLASGEACLARVLKVRPKLGEAIALQGALKLEEARSLSASSRTRRVEEAQQAFREAFSLNRNLMGEWKSLADSTQSLARPAS
ncbi:MAG: protein kinase [Geothrix sp.]|uniref:serine/threonine-protein kinase n=1 Tax=Geothrix sp. TaxID=1962974 RepID=UPI0017AD4679|nr:serine/threonine-protein kinase [Geothrix sp.]NWJ39691.1 protein kinase [Geothrix sp.]WIL22290.1 MAG: protein kinase [Geothrix sp.]